MTSECVDTFASRCTLLIDSRCTLLIDSELVQGQQLLCLWSGNFVGPSGTNISNTESPDSVLLQVSVS